MPRIFSAAHRLDDSLPREAFDCLSLVVSISGVSLNFINTESSGKALPEGILLNRARDDKFSVALKQPRIPAKSGPEYFLKNPRP